TWHGDPSVLSIEVLQIDDNAYNFYPQSIYQSAIMVWLHFAEIDNAVTAEEQSVFNVLINGDTAFKDVDIVRVTGERFTALVLNKTVAVRTHAIINAIEVFEIIPAEKKTLPQEVSALRTLKGSLGLPLRLGWNGDPCVPEQHPWSGVDCQFDNTKGNWFIDGLGLDNQGLKGVIPVTYLNCNICKTLTADLVDTNLSGNSIKGNIPISLGTISAVQVLDLSYNELNGSIPESLGELTSLQILNLNANRPSGRVPASLLIFYTVQACLFKTRMQGSPCLPIPGKRTEPHLQTSYRIIVYI
ncbi:hypothetical protein ACJX0J_014113, partial [Zea mays]